MGELFSTLRIIPLGAGNEVGRSCIVLSFKGKNIMLDCGIHPGQYGLAALPYFDEIDPAAIDVVLITHFHLDHMASLPYFMEKTAFAGKVFMTHPTKAIYRWLLSDFIRVSNISPDDSFYDEKDLLKSYDKIQAVDYHQEVEVGGVRFTCFNAGHVLGAAMFVIEIAGVKILYTGDYSREEDRHLLPAEMPHGRAPDIMICESTYGVQSHEPRMEREKRFTSLVHEVVNRGGRCLLPVFALGKAQELLLILDEYWSTHPELHGIPIYYASSLAKKCLAIYQTYLNMMNPLIRQQRTKEGMEPAGHNPFVFKHISNVKNMEAFDDSGPCVMMASPGMLQSGLSRQLFEAWCSDPKNGIVISGYCVEGTLAKSILAEPKEIASLSGHKLPLKMSVEYISFSAHVDFLQNSQFIEAIGPNHLILVHGESNEMGRLRLALEHKNEEKDAKTKIYTPRNCETVELRFSEEKVVRVVGSMAQTKPNEQVEGVLVGRDFEYNLMKDKDLPILTTLKCSKLRQRQWIKSQCPFSLIEFHLDRLFGKNNMNITRIDEKTTVTVMRRIVVHEKDKGLVLIEWEGSPMIDLMADSIVSLVISSSSSPSSVKLSRNEHKDEFLHLLGQYYAEIQREGIKYRIIVDGEPYAIDLENEEIDGSNERIVSHLKELVTLYKVSTSEKMCLGVVGE